MKSITYFLTTNYNIPLNKNLTYIIIMIRDSDWCIMYISKQKSGEYQCTKILNWGYAQWGNLFFLTKMQKFKNR